MMNLFFILVFIIFSILSTSVQDLKKALHMTDEAFTEKYKAPKPQQKDTNIVFAGYKSVKSSAALEIAHKMGFKK